MREKLSDIYKKARTSAVLVSVFIIGILVIFLYHMMIESPELHTFLLVMFIAVVAVLLYCLLDNPRMKAMKKYNLTEEMLDAEFQRAEEVYKNELYVSDDYIIHMLYAGMNVFKIDDIVWMHKEYIRDHKALYRKEFYIVIYTKERKKSLLFCPYPCHDERETDSILNYVSKRFPHILVGYSKEAKQMFKKDFERFLQVKYNYGIKKRYERKSEKQV